MSPGAVTVSPSRWKREERPATACTLCNCTLPFTLCLHTLQLHTPFHTLLAHFAIAHFLSHSACTLCNCILPHLAPQISSGGREHRESWRTFAWRAPKRPRYSLSSVTKKGLRQPYSISKRIYFRNILILTNLGLNLTKQFCAVLGNVGVEYVQFVWKTFDRPQLLSR